MLVTQSLVHQLEHHGSYYTLHLRTTTQGLLFKYTLSQSHHSFSPIYVFNVVADGSYSFKII